MSVAGEKEKPPESASSGSVTDVSRFPIEDEDSNGKYEMPGGGGGTVYRVVLLGNMFESFYALFGLIAVVTGMFTTWAITSYAVSTNRAESDEDEFGTDIDNPEKSPTKDKKRRRSSNDGPDDSRIGTAAENSTPLQTRPEHPNQAERARRRLGSDSESTHSSVDDFADAMDTVQHSDDYPDSGRPSDGSGDTLSRDRNVEEKDDAYDIVDQAMDDDDDDEFVNLDIDGSEVMQGNRNANVSQHSVDDGSLSDDVLVESDSDSSSEIGIDEALDDAYAMLDMQNDDESSRNNVNKEITSNSHPAPVNEDVKLSLTSAEESTPKSSSIPESHDGRHETLDESEEGTSVDKDLTMVQTSVEYVMVESHDVPNAPVVKNAIDDDFIEDGSDDTTTSSDADTVKDAGGDIKTREHDLDRDERIEVVNVVADLISNEMVRDAEEDLSETEHDMSREERTDAVNVVSDLISNTMVDDAMRDMDVTRETFHKEDTENVDDVVQPVDSQEVECWLSNNQQSDEANYAKKRINVENIVAESLANEMVIAILDELAITSRSTSAADDSELQQTVVSKNRDDQSRSYRRVSDGPIPQIRIDSFDDDGVVVEVSVADEEFASPQSENEYENTSALPDVADDHTVPDDDDDDDAIAKEAYKANDYIPKNDENQHQRKPETQHSIESNPDVLIVATAKTSHNDPTDVKDLLTKLTGEDIPSRDADDEGEIDSDPKLGMAEFMATIGCRNFDDHNDDSNDQRQAIDEEIITSATARPVECSNIDAFCSRPQEPNNTDNEHDIGISVHQDLQTKAAFPTNQDSEDQVVIARVTVPKTNLRDVLSSLGGEGYNEAEKVDDSEDDTKDLRIEDFLLADVKLQPLVDSGDYNEHLYDGEPINEDSVLPAPVSVDDSKDVDYFSNINGNKDDHEQIPPSHDEVVVPRPVTAAEAGPYLDVSSVLAKVPVAPPSNITPRKVFDDDVVATDIRNATNGRVNLKSLLRSLGGDLSVDVDLNDSDVGEASPQRKKVITDEMVKEAIQYLLQRPFLYSYGMYDSQDTLFYDAVFDDSFYTGGRTFALVSNLHGRGLTPEKKSTIFALVSSSSRENLEDDDDYLSDVDEPIFPDRQDEEECEINFDELFANLERRPNEEDPVNIPPVQVVKEDYIADNSGAIEEAVPEASSERLVEGYQEVEDHPAVEGYPGVEDHPAVEGYPGVEDHPAVEGYPGVEDHHAVEGYPGVEDAVPERWGPDSISYSDDDSSSVSSSDTSGTYILDNQMGLVEEDEEEEYEQPRFKQPSYPSDMSHDTTNASREFPSYHGYYHVPYEVQEEEEEDELPLLPPPPPPRPEDLEQPQTSRMFFITSAMLAQMSEQQHGESSSDNDYERRGRQSASPVSSSSEDYLEEIPHGYGPNSERAWPQDPAPTAYHQYLPVDDPARSYPSEVPTAEYDYDNETKFRPISGGQSSVEPTPRYPTSHAPKNTLEVSHPSQNGHGLSDYDSSPELLEIEKQRQQLFPPSPHDYNPPPQKSENLQNGDNADYLPERLLPAVEPTITMNMNYPDETAPSRIKDMFENVPNDFKHIPEPPITRDMNVPEQLQAVFARPVFHQGLPDDDPGTNSSAQSHESLYSYPTRDPGHVEPNMVSDEYARTNGHHEPLSQSEDSMWSHSDYRGYSGSSEDDVEDDTSFASGERMFALVGLPSNSPHAALSVTASIEVYRAEEHMETQRSLYSYEINKGIAGPDGQMVKLQEQSFSFERRSDIVIESIDSRYEAVISDSVSDSAGEQFSQPGQRSEHPEEPREQSLASAEHHSDSVEDSIDSPGEGFSVNEPEGFSMNETVTADFSGEQYAQPPEQQANDYQHEDFKLDLPFDSAGEEMSEREGLQRQVESLSELLSERTLDMQRFKDDYPFLDRIMANPKEGVTGYGEGQLIGLLETYRQLEEDVLELMNIYKETKSQLTELDFMERA